MNFCFLEPCRLSDLAKVYCEISNRLKSYRIDVVLRHEYFCSEAPQYEVLLLQDPTVSDATACDHVYGLRYLNRYQRMWIVRECKIATAEFGSPKSGQECLSMAESWGSDCMVFKKDFSSGGRQVSLLAPEGYSEFCFEHGSDIVMRSLDSDGSVFKVDAFHRTAICTRKFDMPVLSRDVDIEVPIDYTVVETTDYIRDCVDKIGAILNEFGCVYYSIDFMLEDGKAKIIELNTSGAARLDAWILHSSIYIDAIVKGFRAWIDGRDIRDVRSVCARKLELEKRLSEIP